MSLPEEFNEWEHLQYTLRKAHNDAVRDFYRDQPDLDIGTVRSAAKHACLMKDEDTADMTALRFWLFWVVCRKMRDNFEPYYGIPVADYNTSTRYRPQITCYFIEDERDVDAGYRPIQGEISVRIMNEDSGSLTEAKLQTLANRINLEFGQGDGYVWQKGKELYTYADLARGLRFQVLARNETTAITMIRKAIDIAGSIYDSQYLKKNEAIDSASAFPTIPGTQRILGQTYREPRKRPIADVRFIYASVKIWGLPKPRILVDKTGYWTQAIIKPF